MKKLLSLVVLSALLIAACGGSGTVAATVNGQEVTVEGVEAFIDSGEQAVPAANFAQFLSLQIVWIITTDAAESDFGISATDDEVTAESERMFEDNKQGDQTREEFLSAQGVTEDFLTEAARQQLISTLLTDHFLEEVPEPTEEEIADRRNFEKASLANACLSHILVETEEEANAIFDRLDAGEEFGALATELSTDTTSGENNGELPCSTLERYVPPFREAALVATVGEVYDTPVESQFGWHVILVTERDDVDDSDLPDSEELADRVRDDAAAADLQTWFRESLTAAEVTVTEEFGTWDASRGVVVPPASG